MGHSHPSSRPTGTSAMTEPSGGSSRRRRRRRERPTALPTGRLVSLDAYRGFIMTMLAAGGFGIAALTQLPSDAGVWNRLDYEMWHKVGTHFVHPKWVSLFGHMTVSFWDLIQPAFMFMVGVAMPYSYARRAEQGSSKTRRLLHAAFRAIVLVLLGVFLQSRSAGYTNWVFPNVLSQIGLGYFFVYLLLGQNRTVQISTIGLILVGYWLLFFLNPPDESWVPEEHFASADDGEVFEGRYAAWSKNGNIGHEFDMWLLPPIENASRIRRPLVDRRQRSRFQQC